MEEPDSTSFRLTSHGQVLESSSMTPFPPHVLRLHPNAKLDAPVEAGLLRHASRAQGQHHNADSVDPSRRAQSEAARIPALGSCHLGRP
jgi:hypothetical protein